jgi:hypothetical protein
VNRLTKAQRDERRLPTERCPAGYLIHGARLCGAEGNRCVGKCAFAYRAALQSQEKNNG